MAKRKINQYKFKPGIGYTENKFPNAHSLLKNNKIWLIDEVAQFIQSRVSGASAYQIQLEETIRDIGYDMVMSTNVGQVFRGYVESKEKATTKGTRQRTLVRAKDVVITKTNVTGDSETDFVSGITAVNNISNGDPIPTLVYTDPGSVDLDRSNAKSRLINNKDFLFQEIKYFINEADPANTITSATDFESDIKMFINVLTHDIFYNTNHLTNAIATEIFVNTLSTNRTLLGNGFTHLGDVVEKVLVGTTVSPQTGNTATQDTSGTSPVASIGADAEVLTLNVQTVIANGSTNSLPADSAPDVTSQDVADQSALTDILAYVADTEANQGNVNAFLNYTYNQEKCERDVNFVLSAYLNDLQYGGNSKTWDYAGKYWEGDVAQVDGTRYPETDTHSHIKTIIKSYIFDKATYPAEQTATTQTITGSDAETDADARIDTLVGIVVDTITTGLSARPAFEDTGAGYVKFMGNYDSSDILLITDTVENRVVYSFNDTNTGGKVENTALTSTNGVVYDEDTDFPQYKQVTDAITKIYFNTNTETSHSSNPLQIFVDTDELLVRPYEFGTDAIERQRTANPLSMLDADFEYGLQPTKWSAISTMRGYPSVYEVPGTETDVTSITTDASAGTNDIGSSLITVTTAGAHGFEIGDAITIKGFDQAVTGYSRGEGAFIIINVPNGISFQYYAKAKVGTSSGTRIDTPTTQLRKAGFYTGASIGTPSFSVSSQGSSGTVRPALTVPIGEDVVPYTVTVGAAPEIGAPLSASSGISTGAQVTGRVGDGGVVVTPVVTDDYNIGDTQIDVQSTTDVQQNLAADRGDGQAMLVNTVVGNTITFNQGLEDTFAGNYVNYSAIEGQNVISLGFGALFDVDRAGGTYTLVAIANGGQDYEVNDILEIPGESLGGITGTNDAQITVNTVDTGGEILTATISGSAYAGNGTFTETGTYNHGNGSGGIWDVSFTNNVFSITASNPTYPNQQATQTVGQGTGAIWNFTATNGSYSVTIDPQTNGVTGYAPNDIIEVVGGDLQGITPDNNAQITINTVDSNGVPLTYGVTGVAPDATNTYTAVSYSTNNNGIGAQININTNGTTYTATFSQTGTGFQANDTITILGTQVGGANSTNDVTITINTVDTGGEILTYTVAGTAVNSFSINNVNNQTNLIGSGARFDIEVNGLTGNYLVTVNQAGDNYGVDQTLEIAGDLIGGQSPANDLTMTITDVNNDSTLSAGGVATVSVSGTAQKATSGFTVADRLRINGSEFPGGADTTNDLTIEVTGVDVDGGITGTTITGTAPNANVDYTGLSQDSTSGSGTNAQFDINRTGTTYTANMASGGANYAQNDTLTFNGENLGGATPTNNCTITVLTVDGSGQILTFSAAGTAVNSGTANDKASTNLAGNGASFNIVAGSGSYTATVLTGGNDYFVDQTFTVLGTSLAGATPTNDLTITISGVDASGAITSVSSSGTASTDVGSFSAVVANAAGATGNGGNFNILRDGTTADSTVGTYTVTLNSPGQDYAAGNKIKIDGGFLGGTTVTNDMTITVDSVDSMGGIITISHEGDAYAGDSLDLYSTFTMDAVSTGELATTLDISFSALATLLITFTNNHGLVPGDTFITGIDSDDTADGGTNNHKLAAGSFLVTSVPQLNQLTFTARAAGAIDTSTDTILGTVYPRPDSFFIHRPFDGGVQLGTGGPQHGAQAIRQSKKYIRYQSGKGIMYTTGALFAPSYDLRSISSDGIEIGSTITVTTDDNDHGLQIGAQIQIIGVETEGYDGTYTVSDITDERTFEVTSNQRLGGTTGTLSFGAQMSTFKWHGATVRSGVFDDQNGIYWEYDGTNLYACLRTATKQIAGTVTANPDSNSITGVNTRFRDQLKAGDRIVIRGMTHVVTNIADQTTMTVTPDYRGVNTASGTKVCLISDTKVKQSEFNRDGLDGTGPSGYNFVYSKMQMIGIEYSWYGAGFIDYMVRGANGEFVYAHRIRNSNVNTEAFMRSGNLPVRYEVTNEGQNTKLKSDIDDAVTTIPVESVSFLPTAGTVYIDNELISYTSTNSTTNELTGCTRSANLTNFQAGASRTYTAGSATSHTARTGVVLVSQTTTPLISHWGSAFLTDGGFDEDRGYIFSYTEQGVTVTNARQTAFMIRLAPSVSNAIPGDLGDRELLNRAQLLLQGLEVTSEANATGAIVVEGILNPQNYPVNPGLITWTGLSTLAQGGQPSFAQVASGSGIQWSTGATTTTTNLTAQATVNAILDSGQSRSRNGNSFAYVSGTDYRSTFGTDNIDPVLGKVVVSNRLPAGTTITGGYISPSSNYGYFFFSQSLTGNINANTANAFTIQSHADISNVPYAFITKSSWEASGATNGTPVSSTSASPSWPANTIINNVKLVDFAGTEYYEVDFNNASQGTLTQGSGTITLEFSAPAYGQPGETVLSFIAQPGERAAIDLGELKELTNTTLGGRGTFPNGPDVLAINVYKTAGSDVNANLILRWGEAQA